MATNEIELVEAVARALYRQSCILHGCGSLRFENLSPEGKTAWLDQARAVIPVVLERAARVADAKAKQWRDFAAMALPAMPDLAVCRVHANKAEELATAIRSMKDEGR